MKTKSYFFLIVSICLIAINLSAQENEKSELYKKLITLPGVTVKTIEADNHFTEAFEIFLTQPVDHLNPNSGAKFTQRIYLRHVDVNKPMIMNNEGYNTNERRRTELAKIIKCNEIIVEHRYFGESKPDSNLGWKYLTTAQAAADHKRIVDLFKSIYKGKWVSTGISKGGQTSIFFKYYYPNAVDVWVPYVAPLNFEKEDKRIFSFFDNVGTEECRNKITEFQRAILKNRKEIIPLLKERMEEKNYEFSFGLDETLEYAVYEYLFAFWQWGYSSCDEIPEPTSSPEELFKHLYTVSSFDYFDVKSSANFTPFFYQAYTELGYYGYETEDFSDLLVGNKADYVSSVFFAPQNVELEFNNDLMKNINSFIKTNGNNMLFIYGGNDTWSATAVEIGENTNAVKMIKKNGSHRTRISSFEGKEKEKIYSILEKWLNVQIER